MERFRRLQAVFLLLVRRAKRAEDEKCNPSSSESHARELPPWRFTRACTSLTKSVQKERLLAVYFFHLCTDCTDLACFSLPGLLPLTFANSSDYDKIQPDDKLSLLGLNDLAPAKVFWLTLRGTQREYSSKPLKHSIVKRILVYRHIFIP